jgi:hypothetical protein
VRLCVCGVVGSEARRGALVPCSTHIALCMCASQTSDDSFRLFGVADVARAKEYTAVLLISFFTRRLQMGRLVPYLSNGVVVVSETGNNAAVEEALRGAVLFAHPGEASGRRPSIMTTCGVCVARTRNRRVVVAAVPGVERHVRRRGGPVDRGGRRGAAPA